MYTLHLITTEDVVEFLDARPDLRDVDTDREAKRTLLDLAGYLSQRHPSWYFDVLSLSGWEASIERGIGMMLRPPSRFLIDAGMDRNAAQIFPIRLEATGGPSGGSYIPASLVPQTRQMLEARLDRQIDRMRDAEMDPVANLGAMIMALEAAESANAGLFEASGLRPEQMAGSPRVLVADRKSLPPELRKRLEEAAKPPKKPGLFARLRGERAPEARIDSAQYWDGTPE